MRLQLIGATSYKLAVETSQLVHNLNRGTVGMIVTMKRNDTGPKLRCWLKDNFGRKVNLHNAKIKFVMKSVDHIGGPDDEVVIVSDQNDIEILSQLSSESEGQFERLFKAEETQVAGKYKAEFQITTRATLKSSKSQTFGLSNNQTLKVKVDGGSEQTIVFDSNDFVSIGVASAQEIIDVLNDQLVGATAYIYNGCSLMIQSDSDTGSIQITGGSAANALGFPVEVGSAERVSVPTEAFFIHILEDLDQVENRSEYEEDDE